MGYKLRMKDGEDAMNFFVPNRHGNKQRDFRKKNGEVKQENLKYAKVGKDTELRNYPQLTIGNGIWDTGLSDA